MKSYSIVPVRIGTKEIVFAKYSKTVVTKRERVTETHLTWAMEHGHTVHVDEGDCWIEEKHGRGIDRFKGWCTHNEKPRAGLTRGSALEIGIGFSCLAEARDWARSLSPDQDTVRVLRAVVELERTEAAEPHRAEAEPPPSPSPDTTPAPTQAESIPAEPTTGTPPRPIEDIADLLPPPWQQAPHERELARRSQREAVAPPPTEPTR